MANLRPVENRYFEDLFDMSGGYVLDFSNNSFAEFFRSIADIDIYHDKYLFNGQSKANRLRAFLRIEPDHLAGKVLSEMIEIWNYQNTVNGQLKNTKALNECKKIANRLLGKSAPGELTEQDFLKEDFGQISIKKLKIDSSVLPILEKRLKEVTKCMQAGASLSVIFLSGSILEGALLGIAQENPGIFNQSACSPKDKNNKVKPFHEWKLGQFIDVACNVGFLGLDVKKFSHALRDFRNYIHPYQQLVSKFSPDQHTAEICFQVLKAAIANLSEER